MAEQGEAVIGTASETLADLRANAREGLCIQTSFPNAGYDMYIAYFPACGHYLVRVMRFGADPRDLSSVITNEAELEEEEVIMRMCFLMEADVAADPLGREARIALEMLMVEQRRED